MDRRKLIGGISVAVVVMGLVVYASTRPQSAPVRVAPGSLRATQYTEKTGLYQIVANYASTTPLKEPGNTFAAKAMKDFIFSTIAQFKKDDGFDTSHPGSLNIVYLYSSGARTLSYIYTTYTDTGGAHGNTDFKTFTFDTESGTELALPDLFIAGSRYLDTLSSIARAKLPAIIGDSYNERMMLDGTTPDTNSFANFFIDNRELVILFPPYAVAPYAAGPQTLRIPLTDLADILKPEYR